MILHLLLDYAGHHSALQQQPPRGFILRSISVVKTRVAKTTHAMDVWTQVLKQGVCVMHRPFDCAGSEYSLQGECSCVGVVLCLRLLKLLSYRLSSSLGVT